MSFLLLDGNKTRDALLPELIGKIKALSHVPRLAIIQVGDRPDSTSFIRAKKSFAQKIGVVEKTINVSGTISQEELVATIQRCNADASINAIIVQLPLPPHLDRNAVMNAIDPNKDADGLTSFNVKLWSDGKDLPAQAGGVLPATARGIRELLNFNKISLAKKRVAVVGRSDLVGKPIAAMCMKEKAIVNVYHSQTGDLAKETPLADILIVAVGKPGLIEARHVREGQVVIDVGINRTGNETLVGDVDFNSVKNIVAAITPVPGGVGPMTVFALFENVVDLCV